MNQNSFLQLIEQSVPKPLGFTRYDRFSGKTFFIKDFALEINKTSRVSIGGIQRR